LSQKKVQDVVVVVVPSSAPLVRNGTLAKIEWKIAPVEIKNRKDTPVRVNVETLPGQYYLSIESHVLICL
jgi:hypothetical protein